MQIRPLTQIDLVVKGMLQILVKLTHLVRCQGRINGLTFISLLLTSLVIPRPSTATLGFFPVENGRVWPIPTTRPSSTKFGLFCRRMQRDVMIALWTVVTPRSSPAKFGFFPVENGRMLPTALTYHNYSAFSGKVRILSRRKWANDAYCSDLSQPLRLLQQSSDSFP